jgi:hypothetical protein
MMTVNSLNTKKITSCKKNMKKMLCTEIRLSNGTETCGVQEKKLPSHLCTLFVEKIADIFESQPVFKNSTGEKYQK